MLDRLDRATRATTTVHERLDVVASGPDAAPAEDDASAGHGGRGDTRSTSLARHRAPSSAPSSQARPTAAGLPATTPSTTSARSPRTALQDARRRVRRVVAAAAAATTEPELSARHGAYRDSGLSAEQHLVRHPVRSAAMVVGALRLPVVRAELSRTVQGRVLHRALTRRLAPGLRFGASGVAVLGVPVDVADYSAGADKQTLRRKVRAAGKRGITHRPVTDPAERRALLQLADEAERAHRDPTYRNADPDIADLLDYDLWMVAEDRAGVPVLLAVIPIDGEWSMLRYFRTIGSGPDQSDARYLMTAELVAALSARGVRHLLDTTHPLDLSNGLRHFQRMVGFRLTRVVCSR